MASVLPSQIVVCADQEGAVSDLCKILEQAGHRVWVRPSPGPDPADLPVDLLVIDGSGREEQALLACGRWRSWLTEVHVPILFIAGNQSAKARAASLDLGADSCLLRPFPDRDFLAQVQALLRIKKVIDRLRDKSTEFHDVHQRLQAAYQEIDQELQLARRVQQSLLPQALPELPGVRFAVHYRPCGRVGGDFYDAFRLDENHVGFYVADVMGHGVPASLLTMFLKKAVRPKEITGREYRILPPEQVLEQLNREMIDQALAENPFITMVYALLDCRSATLAFARAGHPYPLHVPRRGDPELCRVHGSLLGVFETQFTSENCRLRPGDKFVLYTDGLDSGGDPDNPQGTDRLMNAADQHRHLPIGEFIAQLARDLQHQSGQSLDDFTLLGLEIGT